MIHVLDKGHIFKEDEARASVTSVELCQLTLVEDLACALQLNVHCFACPKQLPCAALQILRTGCLRSKFYHLFGHLTGFKKLLMYMLFFGSSPVVMWHSDNEETPFYQSTWSWTLLFGL